MTSIQDRYYGSSESNNSSTITSIYVSFEFGPRLSITCFMTSTLAEFLEGLRENQML